MILALLACETAETPYVPPGCTLEEPVTFSTALQIHDTRRVPELTDQLFAGPFATWQARGLETGCPSVATDGAATTLAGPCETDTTAFTGTWTLGADAVTMEAVVAQADGAMAVYDGVVTRVVGETGTVTAADVSIDDSLRAYTLHYERVDDDAGATWTANTHVERFGDAPAGDACLGHVPSPDPDDPDDPDDAVLPSLTTLIGTNEAMIRSWTNNPCEDVYLGEARIAFLCPAED